MKSPHVFASRSPKHLVQPLWLFAAALLLTVFLLSACSAKNDSGSDISSEPAATERPLSVSFEKKNGTTLVMEPMSGKILFTGEYSSAEVNGRTYDFERNISEDDCLAFIRAEEDLLLLLDFGDTLTVRTLTDYPCFSDSENRTVYLGANACCSWRQILATLSAIEGDYTNFGYLYAKADRLAAALGWARDDQAQENESVFGIHPALLNLNYLCFDETYSPLRKINACKALALSLNGETETEFLAEAASWAKDRCIDFTPSTIRFAPFGRGCPLKIRMQDLEIFRKADFNGDYLVVEKYTDQDPFADVDSLLAAMTSLDEKTTKLRQRIGVNAPPTVSVILTDGIYGFENVGYLYRIRQDRNRYFIDAASLSSLGQSYAALLFSWRGGGEDPAFEDWMLQALGSYFDFDGYFELFRMQTEKEDPSILIAMELILGEPYDSPEDYVRIERYTFQYYDITIDKKALQSYPELLPVFGYWFSSSYGEDVFLDCMLAPSTIPALTGKTLSDLIVDFGDYLKAPPDDGAAEL